MGYLTRKAYCFTLCGSIYSLYRILQSFEAISFSSKGTKRLVFFFGKIWNKYILTRSEHVLFK